MYLWHVRVCANERVREIRIHTACMRVNISKYVCRCVHTRLIHCDMNGKRRQKGRKHERFDSYMIKHHNHTCIFTQRLCGTATYTRNTHSPQESNPLCVCVCVTKICSTAKEMWHLNISVEFLRVFLVVQAEEEQRAYTFVGV